MMDQSASAPPMGWTDEKSSMGQPPPPPYHDAHGPGYPPQPQQQYGAQYGGQQPYQPYPAQPGAITVQPAVYVTRGPLANPVNDYLGYSIFTMLCCCLPLGIAALISSISAREANHTGDQMAAERHSRMARTLNHVAVGLGIGAIILFIIYAVVMLNVIQMH